MHVRVQGGQPGTTRLDAERPPGCGALAQTLLGREKGRGYSAEALNRALHDASMNHARQPGASGANCAVGPHGPYAGHAILCMAQTMQIVHLCASAQQVDALFTITLTRTWAHHL